MNPIPMKQVYYIGLDTHKETIAVATPILSDAFEAAMEW